MKPSEETPQTAALLGEVMNSVGVPAGVYNVVNGFGPASTGEFLTTHPGVSAITFTGETRTGAAIMKAAADGARPVSLEMGGKNPAIVFADADLDSAIEGTMRSAFMNTGQVCLGTERVYVERPLFDRFVSTLKTAVENLRIGPPSDPASRMGPLISLEHRQKVLSYYAKAVEAGAKVVTGGGVPEMPGDFAKGAWVQPTIWTGLSDDAAVCTEEIFGPCCHVFPFDAEDEVIDRANATNYGLSAAVWTRDLPERTEYRPNSKPASCGELVVPSRSAHRVRRRQALRHRSRRRRPFPRILHRVEKCLRQALNARPLSSARRRAGWGAGGASTVAPLSGGGDDLTIEDAYRIQQRMLADRRRQASGS